MTILRGIGSINGLAGALLVALAVGARAAPVTAQACDWPDWNIFKSTAMSADGRVTDASENGITTSEGQSYGLFFALVANDRASFDKLLAWTENKLAGGDLAARLPAWLWGRRSAGQPADWDVLDTNSASDADLWIAYTLLEAGRLWHERRYRALGSIMARAIVRQETAQLPGLGRTLLPGADGFHPAPDLWRLNPSYVPLQLMRGLASALPHQAEWKALVDTSAHLVNDTAPRGFSPDWVLYRSGHGFEPDVQTRAESAYNAVRVYLWAGMLAPDEPLRAATLRTFAPLADYVSANGFPPERIDTRTGESGPNAGNAGFSAAVAPYLAALGRDDLARAQQERARAAAANAPLGYYSSVLTLFGIGYLEGRYRFDAGGRLVPAWTATCPGR
ncbi:MAG TPA: cellulose synthase complex periplasmic endoglucanase BcsZ [Bordetella sp.]